MFSFLTSRTATKSASSSHPSQHQTSRSSNSTNFQQSTSNLEGGYDDVTLEVGSNGGSNSGHSQSTLNQQQRNNSRPDFSRELSSSASFVGGGGSSNQNSSSSAQYPPIPVYTRPSPTSGYPSLRSTFIRLENHLAETVPSLLDSLCPPLTPNSPALTSLIDAIAPYKLPQCVIEAYNLHDGQDPFASTTVGLFWGLWWMPLDLVEIEWRFWRKFEEAGGSGGMQDAFSASTEGRSRKSRDEESGNYLEDSVGRTSQEGRRNQIEEVEDGQSGGGMSMIGMGSFPKGWVRRKYSHPGWLPLLTDRAGNYVGVDLDPPPPLSPSSSNKYLVDNSIIATTEEEGFGQPGQVIAFGREIDEKVVLFPGDSVGGWGRFLAGFTDDVIRGEFARLGEVKRGKRSAWGNGENENGSNSNSRNNSGSDEEWDEGDGIGESSYIDGDRYGDEGEESGGSEEDIWNLRTEYRKWLSETGEGGIVGALAERSRRKWKSVGVGIPKPIASPLDDPVISTPSPRNPPLSVVVPSAEEIEVGPLSGATERPNSPNFFSNSTGERGTVQEVVEVRLSPPSPTRRFSHQQSQNSISSNTSNSTTHSRDHLNDGRFDRRPHQSSSKPRRRPPPPAPMPLDLPTVFDIIETPPTPSYDQEILASDQPYQLTPTLSPTSFSSNEGTKPLPAIRPSTSSQSINVSKGRISPDNRHLSNGVESDSTVALVSEEGEVLSLSGLNLDNNNSRRDSNDLMEIVVA